MEDLKKTITRIRNEERRCLVECPRCNGFMVFDRFQDLRDSTGELHFFGSRCLICGEILDLTILQNREDLALEIAY